MIPICGLFESHLTVADLPRSLAFYGDTLGLKLAAAFPDRKVAFFWIGPPGHSMLGLWESGSGPNRMQLHIAFQVDLADIVQAATALTNAGIQPLDFNGEPSTEPQVLAWMPAASIYFRDPDGHMLEFLAMLPDSPTQAGVIPFGQWNARRN